LYTYTKIWIFGWIRLWVGTGHYRLHTSSITTTTTTTTRLEHSIAGLDWFCIVHTTTFVLALSLNHTSTLHLGVLVFAPSYSRCCGVPVW
jgi:hypothetical protein